MADYELAQEQAISEINEVAPDFRLIATEGHEVGLADFRGREVLLVFFRGAWCPYCRTQLVQLREQYPELQRAGAAVLAVSVDTPAESAALKERLAVPFPILSDPDHRVIDRYGVFHHDEPRGRSIARPSLFVIDGAGQIRYKYVGLRPSDRPDTATLLHLLAAVAQA